MMSMAHAEKKEPVEVEKFLTFSLLGEIYGVAIQKVQEIIGMLPVTSLPEMPPLIRGLINLRGRILPVVDIAWRFGGYQREVTPKTCIVVVNIQYQDQTLTLGVIVDEVAEVLRLPASQLEPTPLLCKAAGQHYVYAVGKVDGRMVLLVELERIFSGPELGQVEQAALTPEQLIPL